MKKIYTFAIAGLMALTIATGGTALAKEGGEGDGGHGYLLANAGNQNKSTDQGSTSKDQGTTSQGSSKYVRGGDGGEGGDGGGERLA